MNDRLLRRTCAAATLAAALAVSGCAAVAEGKMAPPVREGEWVEAAAAKPARPTVSLPKNRWTLLVVFRPGSLTCAEEMAEVLAFKQRFGPSGLAVIGVTAADREDAEAFVHEVGIDFPVLADAEDVVDSSGIPEVNGNHTYLINPPGVVVAQGDLPAATRILEKYMKRTAKAD
jgi:peroxiredoxin